MASRNDKTSGARVHRAASPGSSPSAASAPRRPPRRQRLDRAGSSSASSRQQPTSIGSFTPLTKAPPKGKVVVYLGTAEVSNVQVANGVQQAAQGSPTGTTSQVSYDAANPATFLSAFNTAIAKHANYVMEAGTPLPPQVITAAAPPHQDRPWTRSIPREGHRAGDRLERRRRPGLPDGPAHRRRVHRRLER